LDGFVFGELGVLWVVVLRGFEDVVFVEEFYDVVEVVVVECV